MNNDGPLPKILCCFLLFLNSGFFSQNETKNWYFGKGAGLDFMTTPPTVLANSSMTVAEGCSSISDGFGNLLFYTDGQTVWDQSHNPMPNGTGLMGGLGSTTQAALIVKQPGSTSLYYIFTQDEWSAVAPNGFRYSIVDMSLAAGLGSVTVKNALLHSPSSEKLAAVHHCNGSDVWVMSHDIASNGFRAYLMNSTGINTVAVLSNVGLTYTYSIYGTGQMKFSPNGRKLGCAVQELGFEIFDFDPLTGIVSNPLTLLNASDLLEISPPNRTTAYSCEFSPDATKFYGGLIYPCFFQWNLCASNNNAIKASKYTIPYSSNTYISMYQMQLAPNGKIYLSAYTNLNPTNNLSVINKPDFPGATCNFQLVGQSIAPKATYLGFPNFVSFRAPLNYSARCEKAIQFSVPDNVGCSVLNYSVAGQQWNFGDPASGSANSSTLSNPTHTFSSYGSYTAQLIINTSCSPDTIQIPVSISSNTPIVNVSGLFTICNGDTRTYTATGADTYSWSTNALTDTNVLSPTVSSIYTVTGTSEESGCQSSKIFTINVSECTALLQNDKDEIQLSIYPNPSDNYLNFKTEKEINITIYNANGGEILQSSFKPGEHSIDISNYADGIYTIKVNSNFSVKNIRILKIE